MKNVSYKIIPNSLRKYRRASGLREKDVAEILGLNSASQVSRWERGVCLPRPLTMFRLAILYRTMVDGLFIDLRRALINDLRKREEKVLGYKTKGDEDR
jgi:transcriptional regulator with XRE-family HTH domain